MLKLRNDKDREVEERKDAGSGARGDEIKEEDEDERS